MPRHRRTPLEYMLDVMNDPNVPEARRDRMANAAAPYCHPRLIPVKPGKKHAQTAAAKTAGIGTPWAKDLAFEDRAN
jgi:hypothetical protein